MNLFYLNFKFVAAREIDAFYRRLLQDSKTDMENLFGEASASMLAIVGLAILVGALVGWFASRSQSRARIDAADFALKDKTAELDAVKHDLQQRDEQINGLQAQCESLNVEKTHALRHNESLRNDVDDLSAKIELLESSQSDDNDEIRSLEETISNLEQKLAATQTEHQTELDSVSTDHASQIETLETELTEQQLASRAKLDELEQQSLQLRQLL